MKQKLGRPTSNYPSWTLWGRVRPHLHLDIGVGKVVLWRQLAVVVDEVVQNGGAQDGLEQGRENAVGEGLGVQGPRDYGYPSPTH